MPVYRFGPFELDPAQRVLRRDGEALALPPRALELIAYLLAHRDRAVGRDELISAVWGRVDVSDNLLDQAVLRARRALGDEGVERRYIATRPRFGFAWTAAVEEVEGATPASPAATAAEEARGAAAADPVVRRVSRALPWLALTGLAALVGLAAWWPGARTGLPSLAQDEARAAGSAADGLAKAGAAGTSRAHPAGVVVFPFAVQGGDDVGWTRLGLMDFVAQRLREGGVATLRSDNVVALLRGRAVPVGDLPALRALAAEAGAGELLQGRVSQEQGQWLVALQWHGSETHAVQALDAQPLDAARAASDALLAALGRRPTGVALPADDALATRLQRIDAAVLADALDLAERELAAVPAELADEPTVRLRAATLQFRRGRLDDAGRRFEALLDQVSAGDDPHLHATLHNALGNLALRRGEPAETERRSDAALAALAGLPPSPELGRALTGRAIARSSQDRFDEAAQDFAQARVVLDAVGDRLGMARVDINQGILEARRDRYAEAAPLLAEAADRLARFQDAGNELFARVALARVRLGLLQPALALAGEPRLAELVAREPNAERRRYADLARAEVLAANGRLREASALLEGVREDASRDGDIILLGVAHAIAAAWLLDRDPAAAAREAQTALNAPWVDESPRQFAATWLLLVRARLASEDPDGAAAAMAGFETWALEQDSRQVLASLWLARAAMAVAGGAEAQAAGFFEAALAAAEASRVPAEWLAVADAYAPWLLARGDGARASAVAGPAAALAGQDYRAAIATARLHQALGHGEAAGRALAQARQLAGERLLPPDLAAAPLPGA